MPSRARVVSAPDPYRMGEVTRLDSQNNNVGNHDTNGKTVRSLTINPAIRNLVLITAGQSNFMSVGATAYSPTNGSALDNLNPYDGQGYVAADPLLGTGQAAISGTFGPGSVSIRVADLLVTNGKFDRVIIVPIAIGGTSATMWATNGALANRIPAAMSRLAARGITPGMTGVTFAFLWGQGESDAGTSTANYTTQLGQVLTALYATGFNGRAFINRQTWLAGVVNPTVVTAQAGVVNNTTVFAGANADSLDATSRQADNTHFSVAGLASFATLIYNAMHASGAPY